MVDCYTMLIVRIIIIIIIWLVPSNVEPIEKSRIYRRRKKRRRNGCRLVLYWDKFVFICNTLKNILGRAM